MSDPMKDKNSQLSEAVQYSNESQLVQMIQAVSVEEGIKLLRERLATREAEGLKQVRSRAFELRDEGFPLGVAFLKATKEAQALTDTQGDGCVVPYSSMAHEHIEKCPPTCRVTQMKNGKVDTQGEER